MNTLNTNPDHIRQILAARTPQDAPATDEEATQIEAALHQYLQQQGWQRTIDDLIVRLQKRLREGPPAEAAPPDIPVTVYTDGACIGNPGPGGWCAIIGSPDQDPSERTVLQGSHWDTTNNRMEMQAVISALQQTPKDADVDVFSDSQYVCRAFNDGWLRRWKRNGWRTTNGAVLNQDLWVLLDNLVQGNGKRTVRFHWVKGHAGNELNEQADRHAHHEAENAARASSPQQPRQGGRGRRGRGQPARR